MVLLFALTDHLGITAASLSVKEFMLVALQASGVRRDIVLGNLLRDILWFGLHPCISVHSGGKKNLDCLEPAYLVSPELLKLKIQLTCTASGLRILNRHNKGHQASSDRSHGAVSQLLSMWEWETMCLQTDHRISQTTLLVLFSQVSKCCHCSGMSNCGCKASEVGGRNPIRSAHQT